MIWLQIFWRNLIFLVKSHGSVPFSQSFNEFSEFFQAYKRQQELKDPAMRDDLAAARAVLKKHSMMLLTASKAYVRHPELAAAKANRDYVLRQVFPFPTLQI